MTSILNEIETFFHINASQAAAVGSGVSTGTAAALKAFGASTAAQAVAMLKQTDIGTTVANDVSAIEASGQTGLQKFEAVVANTLPLVLSYVTGGGIAAVEADVEGIARTLVQTIYTDVMDTGFGKIGTELVALLTKSAPAA